MREIVERQNLDGLAEAELPTPVRFVFMAPAHGGPSVGAIRKVLAPRGVLRLSGTPMRTFADLDPGPAESVIVALDTIVRSDAAGLERMLLSVLPHVDEIVLGVDARSDDATHLVAERYADTVHVFTARDLGLPDEAWAADKIHFAAARNLGRARVKAPWTLVIDTDEYLASVGDLRKQLRDQPDAEHLDCAVGAGGIQILDDRQRLARTRLRWLSASHNQLLAITCIGAPSDLRIVEDKTLRARDENARRNAQREQGIEELVEEAGKGNLAALLHLAKHRAGAGDFDEAVKLVEDYRLRIEPHSILADQRALAALTLAFRCYYEGRDADAEVWALRALLDGPRVSAFCLLGDLAEEQGDLVRARGWYEAACSITTAENLDISGVTALRFSRLEGIKTALIDPAKATAVYFVGDDEEERTATSS